MSVAEGPTPRAQPFYCPYCGEQDFVPFGEEANGYFCNSCARHFIVKFVGLGPSKRESPSIAKPAEERF